jgi:hypothetical protein
MPSARCPDCDALVKIQPTMQLIAASFTARRWRLDEHERIPDEQLWRDIGSSVVFEVTVRCEGSGKLI